MSFHGGESKSHTQADMSIAHRHSDDIQVARCPLLDLPNELLLEVVEHLEGDNKALAAVVRSCKHLRSIADDLLYKNIIIPPTAAKRVVYLVRTLLERPTRSARVNKLSVPFSVYNRALECDNMDSADLAENTQWISDARARVQGLSKHGFGPWVSRIDSGYTISIAAVLMTLLSSVVDLQLLTYCGGVFLGSDVNPIGYLFGMSLTSFIADVAPALRYPLGKIRRLGVLGGSLDLLHLPFDSVEILEIDLVCQMVSNIQGKNMDSYSNLACWTQPSLAMCARVHTVVLRSDWSELSPAPPVGIGLFPLLAALDNGQLRNLELHITRSPRYASAHDTSFALLVQKLSALGDTIETLTIDYTEGPDFDPRAGLSQCRLADSFSAFSRLRKLVVLQQALINCNYRRSIYYELDLEAYFPATLESVTIVCPTVTILGWLEGVQAARSRGEVTNLGEVILRCRCSHGDSPETFDSPVALHLFRELHKLGVFVTVEEETVGAFAAKARATGSVWEADWAGDGWVDDMFGADG